MYDQATPETLFYSASAAQKMHKADSTIHDLMDKLQPFVSAIEQYGQALDVYANAYPLALSPLWGIIRVVLRVCRTIRRSQYHSESFTDFIPSLQVNLVSISISWWTCSQGLAMYCHNLESTRDCSRITSDWCMLFLLLTSILSNSVRDAKLYSVMVNELPVCH